MRLLQAIMIVALATALAGCPKKPTIKPDAETTPTTSSSTNTTAVAPQSNPATSELAAEQAAIAELQRMGTVIYFDYDKAEIKSEYVPVVAANAKFLNGNANRRIRIEGHTDERGSREYNIGLGERRAQAVRRALMLQGVTDAQITTISYGEERPAASGSDDEAYAKNRRAELSYGR